MAFVPSSPVTDPNAPQQPGAGSAAPNAPMNLPPAPATSSGVGGTSGNVGGAPAPGGGVAAVPNAGVQPPVQNLQDYLTANQPQAVAMGQQIAGNLTTGANKVTGDIGSDLAAVDQRVQASNTAPDSALVTRAATDPANFVTNPNDLAAFLAQENANYTGPTSIESTPEWQALTTEVQNAQQNAPDVTKPGGFLQLAAGQETNPTAGMTNLDAALLQETPGAAAPIIAASQPYAALPGQQTTAATAENAAIAAAKANDAAAAGLISPAFLNGPNAEVPAWEQALLAELTNAQKGATNYNTGINSGITTANQEEQALAALQSANLNPQGPIFGTLQNAIGNSGPGFQTAQANVMKQFMDPINAAKGRYDQWLNAPSQTTAPTQAGVATPQDYATEAALEQLLGSRFSAPPITQATKDQAGTYTTPALPSASLSDTSTMQYLNDLISMYSSPADNPFGQGNYSRTPAEAAAYEIAGAGNSGINRNPTLMAVLQRLAAGETA